jgi:Kdo2-lipid IVA lauroyltransferase/acyltransferase
MSGLSAVLGRLMTHASIGLMRALAFLPLRVTRALGWAVGRLLFVLIAGRRRVVLTNLALCFPEKSEAERLTLARETFVYFTQAWLDRAWLWHAPTAWVQRRVAVTGAIEGLQGTEPVVVFVPHFMGLDAAWGGVAPLINRVCTTIYTDQSNKTVDAWILRGRQRFGNLRLFGRIDGVKEIVKAIRDGQPFYLLPDMDFGPDESVFVPFYGIPTATVPSLSRFARLGRAKVLSLMSRMTPDGYQVEIHPVWDNFPTHDAIADTAVMNAKLERYIATMPSQYYWVHKRFKTRPAGDASFY